jgi:hypothetical protein
MRSNLSWMLSINIGPGYISIDGSPIKAGCLPASLTPTHQEVSRESEPFLRLTTGRLPIVWRG